MPVSPAERSRCTGFAEGLRGRLHRVAAVAPDALVGDEVGQRHHPAGAVHHARVARLLVCQRPTCHLNRAALGVDPQLTPGRRVAELEPPGELVW